MGGGGGERGGGRCHPKKPWGGGQPRWWPRLVAGQGRGGGLGLVSPIPVSVMGGRGHSAIGDTGMGRGMDGFGDSERGDDMG